MQENTEEIYSINQRILQLIDYYGFTRYKFSQETGISEAVLLNIYKGKNKPSYDVIEKVLQYSNAIDANWLLMGRGEMFIAKNKNEIKSVETSPTDDSAIVLNMIKEKDAKIEELSNKIGRLRV